MVMKYKMTIVFTLFLVVLIVICYELNNHYPLTYIKFGVFLRGAILATVYLWGRCWYNEFKKANANTQRVQ